MDARGGLRPMRPPCTVAITYDSAPLPDNTFLFPVNLSGANHTCM